MSVTLTKTSDLPTSVPEPEACQTVACYQQRNGRECWSVRHADGKRSFGHESRGDAVTAARTCPTAWETGVHSFPSC